MSFASILRAFNEFEKILKNQRIPMLKNLVIASSKTNADIVRE